MKLMLQTTSKYQHIINNDIRNLPHRRCYATDIYLRMIIGYLEFTKVIVFN